MAKGKGPSGGNTIRGGEKIGAINNLTKHHAVLKNDGKTIDYPKSIRNEQSKKSQSDGKFAHEGLKKSSNLKAMAQKNQTQSPKKTPPTQGKKR